MKVLLVNNHHQIKGGTERYYFELGNILKKKGHGVAFFSTADPGNISSEWDRYFIEKMNFGTRGSNLLKKISKVFYSFEAKKKIGFLLDDFKPDIVHIQNIYFYITPSILGEIKKRNIPIIQTIHDYNLISPSNIFFHNGKVCEITKKKSFYKAIFHKCVRDDLFSSLISVATIYSQSLLKFYERSVDCFIFPSNFMKRKFEEYGFEMRKSIHLPNFIDSRNVKTEPKDSKEKKYILYFGNLLPEKGIQILIKAAGKLPDVNFEIAGTGFYGNNLKRMVSELYLKNVRFLGFLGRSSLNKKIANSEFCLTPSLWFENMPYSVLESFGLGKTVVASRIGGIPEVVKNGKNGLLFEPGNSSDLMEKIKLLWNNKKLLSKLNRSAFDSYRNNYSPEKHYKKLIKLYSEIISSSETRQ